MSQRYQKGNLTLRICNPPLNQDLQDVAGFFEWGVERSSCPVTLL
jgi:hypothetical protein